jgi:2-keto-4-pentenoate hydratase
VRLIRNGATVGIGTPAAAMGHPLRALGWLAAAVADGDAALRAGDIVLTGGLTAAVPVDPGDTVEAVFGANDRLRLIR